MLPLAPVLLGPTSRVAAHFDLSRFHNIPPQLAASLTSSHPQEDAMSDPNKTSSSKRDAAKAAPAPDGTATTAAADAHPAEGADTDRPVEPVAPAPVSEATAEPQTPAGGARLGGSAVPTAAAAAIDAAAQPTAQVIDLDGVRAEERRATLAYVTEVHELCALTGRGDLAAGFIARAAPVAQVRKALLEARAAEDEATAIRSHVRPATVEPAQLSIDTAAIYAARNQNAR
jgi:hypothetical protein